MPVYYRINGIKSKKSGFFENGKVRGFWKYHSCRFWAIFGNFSALCVNIAIVVKRKVLKSNFYYFIMAIFTPNALKSPKIDMSGIFRILWLCHFQKGPIFWFYVIYSPGHLLSTEFFEYIPFCYWSYRDPNNFLKTFKSCVNKRRFLAIFCFLNRYQSTYYIVVSFKKKNMVCPVMNRLVS